MQRRLALWASTAGGLWCAENSVQLQKSTRHGQVAVLGKHKDVVRAGRLPTRWRRFLEGSGDLEIRIVPSTRLGRPRAPQRGEGPVRRARSNSGDATPQPDCLTM